MKVAVTGGTGFIGRFIVRNLVHNGHSVKCWYRTKPNVEFGTDQQQIEWIPGELRQAGAANELLQGCDALVHAAFWRKGKAFRGAEGNLVDFCERNILGSLELFQQARELGLSRVIYISSCSVHEKILSDRRLDEQHPTWALTHYGAHKAAIEQFVHSIGLGDGYPICSLRPTGVYGRHHELNNSKWFELIQSLVAGQSIVCNKGGKEVHAADVARAVDLLLTVDSSQMIGESFNCYDRYVSQYDVAQIVCKKLGNNSLIKGEQTRPKHQIETGKLRALGMQFGGDKLLEESVSDLVDAINATGG